MCVSVFYVGANDQHEAQRSGIITLDDDKLNGNYVYTLF